MVDEDEQLARVIQESLMDRNGTSYDTGAGDFYGNGPMHGGGNGYANGDIYYPRSAAFSMDFRYFNFLVDVL